jgi:hypothetical protein
MLTLSDSEYPMMQHEHVDPVFVDIRLLAMTMTTAM